MTWPSMQAYTTFPDRDQLFDVLVKAACPAPCIGRRDPDGEDWHEVCERKALKALDALRPQP